jgi:hypothetical protein
MVLIGVILVVSAILLASYWFTANRTGNEPGQNSTIIEGSGSPAQSTKDEDLHTAAKKLTGDLGIVSELTGGSTKGGVIAMVVFSIIGLGYLAYGKKSQQLLMILCGIGLMGYSYFVDGTLYIILIGLALSVLPFVLGRH